MWRKPPELAETKVKNNADVNAYGDDGSTPLTRLAEFGHTLIGKLMLRLLIENGADVNQPDEAGITPLMYAANAYTLRLFLKRGAKVNAVDNRGATALHYATARGRKANIKMLLNKGVSVDARDHDRFTPLMAAAYFRHLDCVTILLAHEANVTCVSKNNQNALQWHEQGMKEVHIDFAKFDTEGNSAFSSGVGSIRAPNQIRTLTNIFPLSLWFSSPLDHDRLICSRLLRAMSKP